MNGFNFEIPSRQSIKGIVVIFGLSLYKFFRVSWIFIIAFIFKLSSSDKSIDITNPVVISVFSGIFLLVVMIAFLRYHNFKFYLKDQYFFLRKGIINKEEISVSKDKIQNVYIKQNLLQQFIDVVSLSIETAGDDKTEIEIVALSKPKADALKKALLAGLKTQLEDDKVSDVDQEIYFKASVIRLFLEGITENHFKSFLLILAFIVGIYNDAKEFIDQLKVSTEVKTWFNLDQQSLMALLLFNLSILFFLLFVAFLFSMIRTFINNYNLTVFKKENGLEISKGLFNKISLNLKASRIQTTTASTNKLKRTLGLYKLAFTQAMANKKQQLKFNIVALNKVQLNELLNKFYPEVFQHLIKHKPHNFFIKRLITVQVIIVLFINVFLVVFGGWVLLLNIPLIIYMVFNAIYTYKKAYYWINEDFIVVGTGMLIETHTIFLEVKKVQSITLNQSVFQKRDNVATLEIHSASRSLKIPQIKKDIALKIKNYLLYKVEFENKKWM